MVFSFRVCVALLAASMGLLGSTAVSSADPPLHHVRYTVTADNAFWAKIYYRDTDPPDFADYSHDPYMYSPVTEADVGPGQPWVRDVMLANPDHWAMVTVMPADERVTPTVHCQLEVDGTVVAAKSGPKGALCSIRNW